MWDHFDDVDRLVKDWTDDLADRDERTRERAFEQLVEIGPAAVEWFCGGFRVSNHYSYSNWQVMRYVAKALGKIGDPRAVDLLIRMLNDREVYYMGSTWGEGGYSKENKIRTDVSEVLVEFGAHAVRPLCKELRLNSNNRRHAGETLKMIRDPHALVPLMMELEDDNPEVRPYATEALEHIETAVGVVPLVAALKDGNPDVRQYATKALGKRQATGIVKELIAAFGNENPAARGQAAVALKAIIDALYEGYSERRAYAIEALGQLADADAVKRLIGAFGRNPDTRNQSAIAIGRHYAGSDVVERLTEAWREENENQDACNQAAAALGKIVASGALEWLIRLLRDEEEDPASRSQAAAALGQIGDAGAVEPLIEVLSNVWGWKPIRRQAAVALGQIGDPHAVGPLIAVLDDQDDEIRANAAFALGRIGNVGAVEPLCRMLGDTSEQVRRNAIVALGEIGHIGAVEPLCQVLGDASEQVRQRGVEALVKIGTPAVELLCRALEDTNEQVRQNAALALGNLGGPDVLPRRILLCDAMSPRDRGAALNVLSAKGRYFSKGRFHQYRTPDARRYCKRMAVDADAEVRNASGDVLRSLDHDRTLLRPPPGDTSHLVIPSLHRPSSTPDEQLLQPVQKKTMAKPRVATEPRKAPLWRRLLRALRELFQ